MMYLHGVLYVLVSLVIAFGAFAMGYWLNDGDESIWRVLRRSVWMSIPGKIGRRTRNTWTRKCARYKAITERNTRFVIPPKPGVTWQQVVARGQYDEYQEHFCFGRAQLIEALAIGFLWPFVLIFLTVAGLLNDVYQMYKWLRLRIVALLLRLKPQK
jgi:hypothetical protein